MAKAIERALLERNFLFRDEVAPIHLSVEAAYWVDRIYREIVRDGCFGYDSTVSSSFASKSSPQSSGPSNPEKVFVNQIEHTHDAVLGPLLVAKAAWEQLDLSSCLRNVGFNSRQIAAAAASVMSRLVQPSSEYALVQWIPCTALPELLGEQVLDFDHKYFYRISDKLLRHQGEIEKHLRAQSGKLFTLERTILLYDLTNTYFEGLAENNPKARRGVSKEKRHDRPLVVLGVIYDGDGFALAHKTFAGNMNGGKSLAKMAQSLQESRCGEVPSGEQGELYGKRSLVVVDAGVATAKNLSLLRDAGFSYLVNDSRRQRKRYHAEFADREAFEPLPERRGKNNKQPVEIRMLQELAREASRESGEEAP